MIREVKFCHSIKTKIRENSHNTVIRHTNLVITMFTPKLTNFVFTPRIIEQI